MITCDCGEIIDDSNGPGAYECPRCAETVDVSGTAEAYFEHQQEQAEIQNRQAGKS